MRGQIKMSRTGRGIMQTIQIQTGVRYGPPDEIELKLMGYDLRREDEPIISQRIQLSAGEAMRIAASLLLSVWEMNSSLTGPDGQRFVETIIDLIKRDYSRSWI
jgi:hypothetical protein